MSAMWASPGEVDLQAVGITKGQHGLIEMLEKATVEGWEAEDAK